jgi:hypothetical protein
VQSRILRQINFLLLDARGVLTDWLSEKSRYAWIFDEVLRKEGVPDEFVLFAPVLSALTLKASSRSTVVGWWALEKPCVASDGVEMQEDSWHDDRMDLDLSTRCFAARLKAARKELGGASWRGGCGSALLLENHPRSATALEHGSMWGHTPENAEEDLVVGSGSPCGLSIPTGKSVISVQDAPPFTFDQVLVDSQHKDLSVGEINSHGESPEITAIKPQN